MVRIEGKKKRKVKKSYSIIVDGQTEVWYLQLMKRHENLPRIDIIPELPKNKKLKELFELVKNNTLIYDKVIWLLDLDVIISNKKVEEFNKYVKQLKHNDRAIILINNPCLEFWFLLHFKEIGKSYSRCDDIITKLKRSKELKHYEKTEKYYKYAKSDIYSKLKPFQNTATENAKKLGNLDFDNIESAKAEIYKIFDILTEN